MKEHASRETVAHEFGHIFLERAFYDENVEPRLERATDQASLLRLLGYPPGTPWIPTSEYYAEVERVETAGGWFDYAQYGAPDERAADAYMACDLGRGPRWQRTRHGRALVVSETTYGYEPTTPRRHAEVYNAIGVLGLLR